MAELTITITGEELRRIVSEELERRFGPVAPVEAKRRRRRSERVRGIVEQVSCTEADALFKWRDGTARDLYLAGKLKGQGDGTPGKHCKVTLSSCRAWIAGGAA